MLFKISRGQWSSGNIFLQKLEIAKFVKVLYPKTKQSLPVKHLLLI